MWANHDVLNLWDTRLARFNEDNVIWRGSVDREEFEKICKRNIEKYFKHPQYYKIDGKPVFMIYELPNLINGLGGVEQTIDALEWFRKEVRKAGFPGLELQMCIKGKYYSNMEVENGVTIQDFVNRVGFDSGSLYQYRDLTSTNRSYPEIFADAIKEYDEISSKLKLPSPVRSVCS